MKKNRESELRMEEDEEEREKTNLSRVQYRNIKFKTQEFMGIDCGDKSNINRSRQYASPIARLTSGIIVREGKSSPNTPLIPRGR